MFTVYQVMMILAGIWIILVILLIRNRMNYLVKNIGDPMEMGDIWSRRRKRRQRTSKKDNYGDLSGEELEKARQKRGKRMREFVKKRDKLASKATLRRDYLINGKSKEELKKNLMETSVGYKLNVDTPDPGPGWMMLGEEKLDNKLRKKVVVEYDDTKSTTHGEYSKTLSDRLDPRDTILRQRPAHFKIDDKPLSWTI